MNQMQIFSLVLILYCQNIFHAWGQQTPAGDSKRKASEYFCVAQCLGLLGTDRPGQACYEESAKMTMKNNKQCEDQSYEKVPDCCKDIPAELLQLPPGDDECPKISKSVGSSMALFLSTYVLTGPTNMAGRLDFSGAELSKRHGGKLVSSKIMNLKNWNNLIASQAYMDCLFVKRKLIKDGAIDFLAAKNDFETNVTNSTWRNVVSNAYISCQYLLAGNSNIPKTISVQIDGVTKDWRTTAGLLYQCIRREMIENCPFKSLTSSACKDIDNNVYMCNPFK